MNTTALVSGGFVLAAYLVGSVSGSLLLGRLRQLDIRLMGSGNAGGTNALRFLGPWFALGVVLIDVGKGVLATVLPALWPGADLPAWLPMACGLAAVFGHCYPVWHGFRGGKGAATAVGAIIVLEPILLLPMLGTWLLVLVISGYVGLATMLAGLSLVPAGRWLGEPELLGFTVPLALFLVYTHRTNITRLVAGTEHRFERVRVTRWFR